MVHLNMYNCWRTQPISTKESFVDMTDIGKFTEPKNKMVCLLPSWEPWLPEFKVQKIYSIALIIEILYLKQNFFETDSCLLALTPCINYMQYPWGYALPVSHIISTCDSYPQYPWGYAVPVSYIGQLWTSFRNKVSQACHKIPEWFISWVYWQSIWDRVWLWQYWRDWKWRQSVSQLCYLFK